MSAAAWESFHRATLELAKPAALKQRLTDAFSRHLQDMPASELPGELRGEFESLRKRMTVVSPSRGETAVVATVRKMSPDEADACAACIVALLDALHRVKGTDNGATGNRLAGDLGNGHGSRSRHKTPTEATARIPTLISINRA